MARRVRDPSTDRRDWITRAADALATARAMPSGPARDEAIQKAEQLRVAGEMMGYLSSVELKPPR
jgi:hypothetical protein